MISASFYGIIVFTHCSLRRTLDEVIENHIQQHIPFSIIMLDLDRFKKVNDTYGYAVGDEVLKFLAAQLKRVTRESGF